jgi:hypothetical protein
MRLQVLADARAIAHKMQLSSKFHLLNIAHSVTLHSAHKQTPDIYPSLNTSSMYGIGRRDF